MKVTARSPTTAKVASKPGVVLVVVVVDSVVLAGSDEGVVLVVVVVDLVTSAAALSASSIIVAISMATNIFFISNLLFSCDRYESRLLPLNIIHNVFRGKYVCNPKFQAVISPG